MPPDAMSDCGPDLLIVAASARAMAQSAVKAGLRPAVIDAFGDRDTRAAAVSASRVPLTAEGLAPDALQKAFRRDTARFGATLKGWIAGAGAENCSGLFAGFARQLPLLGNRPDVFRRCTGHAMPALAADCGLPCVAWREELPALSKSPTAAGGAHIRYIDGTANDGGAHNRHAAGAADTAGGNGAANTRHAIGAVDDDSAAHNRRIAGTADNSGNAQNRRDGGAADDGARRCRQTYLPGVGVSHLFVADGRSAVTLGFSTQWHSRHCRERPFAYGGAVNRCALSGAARAQAEKGARALTAALGLRGINNADYLYCAGRLYFLELNPRPGATLALMDGDYPRGLLDVHLQACFGHPAAPRPAAAVRACAVVYAAADIVLPDNFDWPRAACDVPVAGGVFRAGDPLCSLMAEDSAVAPALSRLQASIRGLTERLGRLRRPVSMAAATIEVAA